MAHNRPCRDAVAITLSDTADNTFEELYIGVTGDVKVTTEGGTAVVFKAVPVGHLRIRTKLVWTTGTTATNLVGLIP